MADAQRTIQQLQSLLQDNTTGAISPQDLRDFMESFRTDYGGLHMDAATETTINEAGTFVKVAGTSDAVQSSSFKNFTHSTNRLTYTGTQNRLVKVSAAITMTAAGNNIVTSWRFALNGTTDVESTVQRKIGTGTDVGAVAMEWAAVVSTNDYIELFVANDTNTSNVTANHVLMMITGFPI